MENAEIIYIAKGYIKSEVLKDMVYIKNTFSDDILGKIWRNYDFEKAEKRLFDLQCKLTKATLLKDNKKIKRLQNKIVYSSEAKMLAVRKVSEISKSAAGVDKIVWRKDSEKMRACISLNNGEYHAKPLKQFILRDLTTGKERQIGIPTNFDRAMQVLYAYALEPISEATADRKSFAFRKGRSSEHAHACIMDSLTDYEAADWILITDISSYYDTISHKFLINNIPIDKNILKEFLNAGFVFKGELFSKEEGISLRFKLKYNFRKYDIRRIAKKIIRFTRRQSQRF